MSWSFDVTANIPRITQSGTDTGYAGIATAISAQVAVARSTAYTTAMMRKPPADNGMWYRCSTAGTTAAVAPTYNPVLGSTTTDGTAVFTAFLAPIVRNLGTTNQYYMPDVRFQIQGTLTNTNPQQENFTCWDAINYGGNWTSGQWCTDGVTPKWDGVHFTSTRIGANGADPTSLSMQAGAQFTFIGGEVQVAGAVGFDSGTTPRSYQTRWRNTKEWGATSSRFRSYTSNAIFRDCEFFDMAFDLFRMPAEFSVKGRACEYLAQYVGAGSGGADAKFTASNIENVDGTYDFDNYFSGWVELYNCKAGAALKVVSQYPNSAYWVRHCVPLYQDLVITAKNTSGAPVQDVRFSCTDSPSNSPTSTIATLNNLKTWDFRNPITYQTTTNASGVATSTPVLNIWYWSSSFKQNLRFPSSTATYEGRAYNYKTMTTSVVLGSGSAQQLTAGMVGLDTATTMTEAVALAQTGITLTPSGATGGSIVVSSNHTLQEVWNYYRAWICQFANCSSNDTWNCLAGNLATGAWTITVNSGVVLSGSGNVTSISTTGTVTNNGTITAVYSSSAGSSKIIEISGVTNGSSLYVGNNATGVTKLFQANTNTSTYRVYYEPGTTPAQLVARELYGKQRYSEVITLADGLNTISIVDIEDVGISQPTLDTVLAYTEIENPDKFYDRTAAFRLTEQGIKLGQMVTRSGTSIETGSFYHLVNKDATLIYAVSGSIITTKATSYGVGSKYQTEIATPPATVTANTTEVITVAIEDANGNSSVDVLGGDGSFQLWKVTTATATNDYATGTLLATVGNGVYRFLGVAGFDIVGVDINSNIRRRCSMAKGIYSQAFYVGDQIQLAQAPQVIENGIKLDILKVELEDIKGTGFIPNTDSLTNIRAFSTIASINNQD